MVAMEVLNLTITLCQLMQRLMNDADPYFSFMVFDPWSVVNSSPKHGSLVGVPAALRARLNCLPFKKASMGPTEPLNTCAWLFGWLAGCLVGWLLGWLWRLFEGLLSKQSLHKIVYLSIS